MFESIIERIKERQFQKGVAAKKSSSRATDTQLPIYPMNAQTSRLMQLINEAIEKWAVENHLENLPRKIIFDQVLDIMESFEERMNDDSNITP